MVIFTIAARNYFGFARTLAASAVRAEPTAHVYVVVADKHVNGLSSPTGVTLLPCQELGLSELEDMAFAYDILEFNTSLKAAAFSWFFARHPESPVIYLDPDIWVLRPLDPVHTALRQGADLALTPHITSGRLDEWAPTDLRLLSDGVYNLGFCAMRPTEQTRALVQWWDSHLRTDCRAASAEGVFVDQKWMEMGPCFAKHATVLRDPGLNVAYWNLPQRPVTRSDTGWSAAGSPLRFMHFSGLQPGPPAQFCKYYPEMDEDCLSAGMRELYDAYLQELHRQDHAAYASLPYGFSQFADGHPVRQGDRLYFRHWLRGTLSYSPFALGDDFFMRPDPTLARLGPPAVPRRLCGVWRRWPELQSRFDLRTEAGRRGFWEWILLHGYLQEDLPPLVRPDDLREPNTAGPPTQPDDEHAKLRDTLADKERELARVYDSSSWRLTAPLRAAARLARGRSMRG